MEESRPEPDVDAVQKWLRSLLAVVAGKLDKAETTVEMAAALRAAISQIRAEVRGGELQVDISLRAGDLPDATSFAPADVPLVKRDEPCTSRL